MKKKTIVALVMALVLTMSFTTAVFANVGENQTEEELVLRYSYIEDAWADISINSGVATVGARLSPRANVVFSYAVMTIELVRSSSGATIQSWSGTYYPGSNGKITFSDTQSLYATGGYYVRVTGTCYAVGGGHEPFSATSSTATY